MEYSTSTSTHVAVVATHSTMARAPPPSPPISDLPRRGRRGRYPAPAPAPAPAPYPYPNPRLRFQNQPCRLIAAASSSSSSPSYSKSDFPDFQDYVKPTRLLAASEVKAWTNASREGILSWNGMSESCQWSLYKIVLRTSRMYGSGISNLDAGILICIIDEHGNSILQRLPSVSYRGDVTSPLQEDAAAPDVLHFQSGSVDEFSFQGPQLGRVQALWVGVDSGNWRIGGLNLVVIAPSTGELGQFLCLQYDFQVQDLLLGEGSDMVMAELRPSQTIEYSGTDPISLLEEEEEEDDKYTGSGTRNEESMKEYDNLKLSLLVYDATLVLAGTSIAASFTTGENENTALAFLTGGVGGFLYLLLLQRYVDRLPAPQVQTVNEGGSPPRGLFAGVNGPLLALAVASGFAVFVAKRGGSSPDVDVFTVLTPKDIVSGLIGFLACKVAVVLAAFKPISLGPKDSTDD